MGSRGLNLRKKTGADEKLYLFPFSAWMSLMYTTISTLKQALFALHFNNNKVKVLSLGKILNFLSEVMHVEQKKEKFEAGEWR